MYGMYVSAEQRLLWATCGKIRYPLEILWGTREPMGKFVTRLIVVCNVDGAKSANGKIRYALFAKPSQVNQLVQSFEPVYTWVRSSHVGVLKWKWPRRVTCVRYLFCVVWEVHRPNQLPIMGTRLRSVSVVYTGQLRRRTQRKSQESCLHVVWVCEIASARRSRIILKGTWLTAQTVIGELSGLFIGIRAPRGYPDCLKTVPAVSVSNSYQRIFGYSNYPPRLSVNKAPGQNTQKSECIFRRSPIAVPTKNCVFIRYPMRTG